MSKEYLEALERMCSTTLEEDLSVRDIYETEYGIVEQALQRLESIDNAEPSEALKEIKTLRGFNQVELNDKNVNKSLDIIEQALNRLEAIEKGKNTDIIDNYMAFKNDNANPSEALEIVDKMTNYILLDEEYDFIDDKEKQSIIKDRDTIKQALLKAQEPKHYLKWEDLEFKIENQEMFVLLNGKPYILYFYKLSTQNEVTIFSIDMHIVTLSSNYPEDVQFFNDLHLERVVE